MASITNDNDPESNDQVKETVKETDKKVAKILKLIKNNGPDKKGKIPEDSKKKSELTFLVEDFHKQYRSLYAQYDHLKEEIIKKKALTRTENESPSSGFSSDSEYYSPRENQEDPFMKDQDADAEVETKSLEESFHNRRKLSRKKSGNETLSLETMADGINKHQKSKEDELNGGLSALVKVHESHGKEASAQIKELEGQLTMVKVELDASRNQKKGLEEKLEKRKSEVRHLGEKNSQLESRVSELELLSKKKGEEMSVILEKLKDNENKMASKTRDLMTQVSNLQMEVESLRAQKRKSELDKKNEVAAQINALKDRVDTTQQELHSLRCLKNELEHQLELKTKEIAEKAVQIESMKEEIERNTMAEQVNEHLQVSSEHSVHNGSTKIEELIMNKIHETDQVRKEKEKLEVKVSELEGKLTDTENELIMSKTQETDQLREENEKLQVKVSELQRKLTVADTEFSNYQMKYEKVNVATKQNQALETEIANLKSKITEQEKILKDRNDTIKKLTEEKKISKNPSMDFSPRFQSLDSSRLSQNSADRKIEELAEKFQMKMENQIRLLYQRILVAEQIQAETKESYINAKKKLEEDSKELNITIGAWESEIEKLRSMLTRPSGMNVLTSLDMMARKLDNDNGDFLNRISRISNELQLARNWISDTNHEMKQLQENVSMLTTKLHENEEKLVKLESMKQDGAIQHVSKVEELEEKIKSKDEMLLGLGEEKKEAIRQLCLLIEYHRERFDLLKQEITKFKLRTHILT